MVRKNNAAILFYGTSVTSYGIALTLKSTSVIPESIALLPEKYCGEKIVLLRQKERNKPALPNNSMTGPASGLCYSFSSGITGSFMVRCTGPRYLRDCRKYCVKCAFPG